MQISKRELIFQMASLIQKDFPAAAISAFASSDDPLADGLVRVRCGSGRVYTVGVEGEMSEDQLRAFIKFAISN